MSVPGSRRRARECALQALYGMDLQDTLSWETEARAAAAQDAMGELWVGFEPDVDATIRRFAEELVLGTAERLPEIDAALTAVSRNWRVDRMARVDRNIMRLAAYEILHREDVPTRVVINEAIELAKRFGTEDSAAFVNGLLDRIGQDPARKAP